MKATHNTQEQENTTPKTVQRSTYFLSLVVTFLVTGIIGVIGGYFVSINVQGLARQTVISDMHVVSKD